LSIGSIATGMAGSAAGNACPDSQLDAMNQQLAVQAVQIQQIDTYLGAATNVFYYAWYQQQATNTATAAYLWQSSLYGLMPQGSAKGLFGNWMAVDGGVGLWTDALQPAPNAPGTPQALAQSDTAYNNALQSVDAASASLFQGYLKQFSGTDIAYPTTCSPSLDCAAHVIPATDSALLNLYDALFQQLSSATENYAQQGQQAGISKAKNQNVVPLYDQYNAMLVKFWTQSLYGLQQAQTMEWLVNQLNYFRGTPCARAIGSWGKVAGTYYCNGGQSLQIETAAYNTAQMNLARVYGARMNQLYLNTLNYIVSDVPVLPQAYPTTPITWTYNGKVYTEPKPLDYATQTGFKLAPVYPGGQGRTPLSLVPAVAKPQGANTPWLAASVLYQFSGLNDVATCATTLQNYLASTSGGTVAGWLQTQGACPSIFALAKGAPLNYGCDTASPPNCTGSFYDGNTLTPYTSYQAATGTTGGPLVLSASLVNNLKFCDPTTPSLVWESQRPGARLNCGLWYAPKYLGPSFPRANPPVANSDSAYYSNLTNATEFIVFIPGGQKGFVDVQPYGSTRTDKYATVTKLVGPPDPALTGTACGFIPTVPATATSSASVANTPILNNVRLVDSDWPDTGPGCLLGWIGEGLGTNLPGTPSTILFAPRMGNGFPVALSIDAAQVISETTRAPGAQYTVRALYSGGPNDDVATGLSTYGYRCTPSNVSQTLQCTILDGSVYLINLAAYSDRPTITYLKFELITTP
jgi:hypothetical protein